MESNITRLTHRVSLRPLLRQACSYSRYSYDRYFLILEATKHDTHAPAEGAGVGGRSGAPVGAGVTAGAFVGDGVGTTGALVGMGALVGAGVGSTGAGVGIGAGVGAGVGSTGAGVG